MIISPRDSGTKNGGTEPYKAVFGGWGFPYISRIHIAYIGEYLHFRYLNVLVIIGLRVEHPKMFNTANQVDGVHKTVERLAPWSNL